MNASNHRRIAIVAACPFPYPRGTPIRILRMAEGLAVQGHTVHVVTYHLGQQVEELPFQIHRIPHIPTYKKLSPGPTYQKLWLLDTLLAFKVNAVVRKEKINIIHAHHYEGLIAGLPAARINKVPIVFDVHTLLSSELPRYSLGIPLRLLVRFGNWFDRLLPPSANHIVTVTNKIRSRLIEKIGIPEKKVTTVYTGQEADRFFSSISKDGLGSEKTLIYTGTLAEYQDIPLMLRAFRKVLLQRPDATLKIITNSSSTPYAGHIEELGNNVVFVEEEYFKLGENLHSGMIALSPRTECDGLPIKMLNYMASGRAVVASEGAAEILEHNRTGLVIPNNDVDAFAAAILELLANPEKARKLGQNARAHIQEFFIWEEAIKKIEAIYASLLEKSTS